MTDAPRPPDDSPPLPPDDTTPLPPDQATTLPPAETTPLPPDGTPRQPPQQTTPLPPPDRPDPARLTRSRTDRILCGVSGGLGNYLGVDSVLIRVGWVIGAFLTGGLAIVAYVILWLVTPEGNGAPLRAPSPGSDQGRLIVGAILVVAGGLWLAAYLMPQIMRFRGFGALILIALGIVLVVQGARR